MNTPDISIFNLGIGLLLVLIPVYIMHYYKTGLVKDVIVSVLRMVVQLFLVGFYMNYLFEWNNMYINIAWMLLMIGVCAFNLKIGRAHV